jgi:putative transposase
MKLIDRQHTLDPVRFGQMKLVEELTNALGIPINRKRVQRLMRLMGIEGEYQKPKTTISCKNHKIYPYLLRDYAVLKPNEVWSTDITYIAMRHGFMYLTAIIDWYSRYVISWELSNTLETDFCSKALNRALNKNKPLIFNTDQGSQFTSNDFTSILANHDISISMDGKGRSLDNIFIERLWRTLKYENIYRHSYETVKELMESLRIYFNYYNRKRIHQSLNYNTPASVYFSN